MEDQPKNVVSYYSLVHFDTRFVSNRDVNPEKLGAPRSLALSLQQMDAIRRATTEEEKKLRTEYGVKEVPNAMLNLSVDLFM